MSSQALACSTITGVGEVTAKRYRERSGFHLHVVECCRLSTHLHIGSTESKVRRRGAPTYVAVTAPTRPGHWNAGTASATSSLHAAPPAKKRQFRASFSESGDAAS